MDHDAIASRIVERIIKAGIDPEKVIYFVNIGDIAACIADYYEEEALRFDIKKLKELLSAGEKAIDCTEWKCIIEDGFMLF